MTDVSSRKKGTSCGKYREGLYKLSVRRAQGKHTAVSDIALAFYQFRT